MSQVSSAVFVQRPWPERPPEDSPLFGRRVLILHGDLVVARELARELSRKGCAALAVEDGGELRASLRGTQWEAFLLDAEALDEQSLEDLRNLHPVPVLLSLSDREHGEVGLNYGARLARRPDAREALSSLGRALEVRTLTDENRRLRESLEGRYSFGNFVTRDARMRVALETLARVSETRATVLLTGESGTGKSLLAKTLHQQSERAAGPFVMINCGALPDSLLESELFGHVRGSFTGAHRDRSGRFEEARGGTIFLDEINSASLDLQVKLLRVLQEGTYERVGDTRTRSTDARVIAASNQDLLDEISAGRFREDLYWRLNVVTVELPPLRERTGDLRLLAEHFLAHYAAEYSKPMEGLDPSCLARLVRAPWPGNVRQLENAMERAVLLSQGPRLMPGDLPRELQPQEPPSALPDGIARPAPALGDLSSMTRVPPLKQALEVPERSLILRALELCEGNRNHTAEMLEINRGTLFNKMRKYGLMDLTFDRKAS